MNRVSAIACVGLLFGIVSSQQESLKADTVFLLNDSVTSLADGLSSGDAVTVDGITLTFSNVVTTNGGPSGEVEDNGMIISANPGEGDTKSFDFTFSQDVQILTYDIGFGEEIPLNTFFTVSGVNGVSGNNTIQDNAGMSPTTLSFYQDPFPLSLRAKRTLSSTISLIRQLEEVTRIGISCA